MFSCLSDMSNFLQGLPNKCAPGCESCLPVLAYEFSMTMAATFSQPGFVASRAAWTVEWEGSAE